MSLDADACTYPEGECTYPEGECTYPEEACTYPEGRGSVAIAGTRALD